MASKTSHVSRKSFSEDETQAALALFNAGIAAAADDERQRRAANAAETARLKAIGDAESAKRDAAARVKQLQASSRASVEEKAEADAAYRAAVVAWQRSVDGQEPAADSIVDAADSPPSTTDEHE